ncbi:MAG: hypothetical protein V2A56_06415 [bacterium]
MVSLRNIISPLIVTVLFLFVTASAHGEFDWGSKYAGDYLSGQSNARLLALGGTGVSFAEGTAALLANPARLPARSSQSLSLMHADRFSSAVKVDYASWVSTRRDGTAFGLGLVRQGVDGILLSETLRDPNLPLGPNNLPQITGSASAAEYAFLLGYSKPAFHGFQAGGSAKLLYKHLADNHALGLGVDVGVAHQWGPLLLGAQLRDAFSTLLVWDTGRQETIVPTLRVGAALDLPLERLQARAMPVVEFSARTETWGNADFLAVKAGFEYSIRNVVSGRIGIDENRLTYGAGLNLFPFVLDYAYIGHEDLGATHRISLQVFWGSEK